MNLLHMKYAVEVARASSISKAAESLYVSQPNLSRAIRELEETLGIEIFKRTPKGISPTAQGEEFLGYARQILRQVDNVEKLYKRENSAALKFSISVPRASYISSAFTAFSARISPEKEIEMFYKETNSMRAVSNILDHDYHLGILRYRLPYDRYFKEMIEEKGLRSELICDFSYRLIMRKDSPLASKERICLDDLRPCLEIAHADPYVPSLPAVTIQSDELSKGVTRRIFVFERGSQMELLAKMPDAFMWVSPVPQRTLDRYDLIERVCAENDKVYRDILICKKDYRFSSLDNLFFDELIRQKRALGL